MNIIDMQDNLKDLPDQALMSEMERPSGSAPPFLIVGELRRRKRMRDDYQRRQNENSPTVAQEAMTAVGVPQGGLPQMAKAMAPKSSIAQNTGMDQAMPVNPTQAPQPQAPQMMSDGGIMQLRDGGKVVNFKGQDFAVFDDGEVYRVLDNGVRRKEPSPSVARFIQEMAANQVVASDTENEPDATSDSPTIGSEAMMAADAAVNRGSSITDVDSIIPPSRLPRQISTSPSSTFDFDATTDAPRAQQDAKDQDAYIGSRLFGPQEIAEEERMRGSQIGGLPTSIDEMLKTQQGVDARAMERDALNAAGIQSLDSRIVDDEMQARYADTRNMDQRFTDSGYADKVPGRQPSFEDQLANAKALMEAEARSSNTPVDDEMQAGFDKEAQDRYIRNKLFGPQKQERLGSTSRDDALASIAERLSRDEKENSANIYDRSIDEQYSNPYGIPQGEYRDFLNKSARLEAALLSDQTLSGKRDDPNRKLLQNTIRDINRYGDTIIREDTPKESSGYGQQLSYLNRNIEDLLPPKIPEEESGVTSTPANFEGEDYRGQERADNLARMLAPDEVMNVPTPVEVPIEEEGGLFRQNKNDQRQALMDSIAANQAGYEAAAFPEAPLSGKPLAAQKTMSDIAEGIDGTPVVVGDMQYTVLPTGMVYDNSGKLVTGGEAMNVVAAAQNKGLDLRYSPTGTLGTYDTDSSTGLTNPESFKPFGGMDISGLETPESVKDLFSSNINIAEAAPTLDTVAPKDNGAIPNQKKTILPEDISKIDELASDLPFNNTPTDNDDGSIIKPTVSNPDLPSGGGTANGTGGGLGAVSGSGGGLRSRIEQMISDRESDRESNKWMALAQTGMALMASKNPTLGGALGEAGLAGVGALQKSKSQYDKDMLGLLGMQEDMRKADLTYQASMARTNQASKGGSKALNQAIDDARASLNSLRTEARSYRKVNAADPITGTAASVSDLTPEYIKGQIVQAQDRLDALERLRIGGGGTQFDATKN